MKIALLTRNPKLYSHQRLIAAAQSRGHDIVPIDYLKCYMNITSKKPELRYLGEKLTGFDAVIPRDVAVSESPSHGLSVIEYQPRSRGTRAYLELCQEILNR